MKPAISVVMPVYNGELYLRDSIDSILNQSFSDFELIIINDGSNDNSIKIIRSYEDPRIIVLNNEENKGLIYSLNRGIHNSKGKYIARMDADDCCHKRRLAEQWQFMEEHKEIGICGTAYNIISSDGGHKKKILESNPLQNRANLMFFPVLAHPSVIIRKSVLDEFNLEYKEEYKHAEDYGLWVEASKYTQISNIKKALLNYRVLDNSITRQADRNFEKRLEIHKRIYRKYFEDFGLILNEEELKLHFIISDNIRFKNYNNYTIKEVNVYFNKLKNKFRQNPYYKFYRYTLSKRMLSLSIIERNYFQIIKFAIRFLYNMLMSKI
ncbi:MAG: glycosyltransferase [Muribaculaceae bacterium]|nr:glycosyltransferase [Muribaculaceae bacterium]